MRVVGVTAAHLQVSDSAIFITAVAESLPNVRALEVCLRDKVGAQLASVATSLRLGGL